MFSGFKSLRQNDLNLVLQDWFLPYLFIAARFIFYLGNVSGNLTGFGDIPRYFEVAALHGWPYFDYWSEYPPVFAFINTLIFRLSNGQQFLFEALMYILFTLSGAVSIWLFLKLDLLVSPKDKGFPIRSWIFLVFLLVLPYSWWYFEMLPVSLMLLGLYYALDGNSTLSGL
ncbi:MAG: hypothetical protein LWX83_19590, partial [Anaerolineae bacterium]|nr:hypothetical protein [Anaerolineae bacterium]